MLTLKKLHQYLFTSRPLADVSNVPHKYQEQVKAQKIKHIKQDFAGLQASQANAFRWWLRKNKKKQLEDIIFGNSTDELQQPGDSDMLDADNVILRAFQICNFEKKFFASNDKQAAQLYLTYYKTCFILQNFFEDSIFSSKAIYNMVVVFGDPNQDSPLDNVTRYIRGNNLAEHPHAVEYVLAFRMPKFSKNIDLTFWRDYVMQFGSALSIFEFAGQLTAQCKAGIHIDDLRKDIAKLRYKRYAKHPKLAELCSRYFIAEEHFDLALETQAKAKNFDLLPNITFDGSTVGRPGYVIAKLPIGDPRAYVLGKITNCCQSIGGYSSSCVVNGVQSPYAGFYVLLRGHGTVHRPDGSINYANYELAGQAYAWLSDTNALVFDSWENLRRPDDDAVVTDLLPVFARHIAQKKPYIHSVTVGSGGNTPRALRTSVLVHEKMREGEQYSDSRNQYILADNRFRQNKKPAIALIRKICGSNPHLKASKVLSKHTVSNMHVDQSLFVSLQKLSGLNYTLFWQSLNEEAADYFTNNFILVLSRAKELLQLIDQLTQLQLPMDKWASNIMLHFRLFFKTHAFITYSSFSFPSFDTANKAIEYFQACMKFRETSIAEAYLKATAHGMPVDEFMGLYKDKDTFFYVNKLADWYAFLKNNHLLNLWPLVKDKIPCSAQGAGLEKLHKAGYLNEVFLAKINDGDAQYFIFILDKADEAGIPHGEIERLLNLDQDGSHSFFSLNSLMGTLKEFGQLTLDTLSHFFPSTRENDARRALVNKLHDDRILDAPLLDHVLQNLSFRHIALCVQLRDYMRMPFINLDHEEIVKLFKEIVLADSPEAVLDKFLNAGFINDRQYRQARFVLSVDGHVYDTGLDSFPKQPPADMPPPNPELMINCIFDLIEIVTRIAKNDINITPHFLRLMTLNDVAQFQDFADAARKIDEAGVLSEDNLGRLFSDVKNAENVAAGIVLREQNCGGVSSGSMFAGTRAQAGEDDPSPSAKAEGPVSGLGSR